MTFLYANNATSSMLGNVGATDTVILLPGGEGARFPLPIAGQSFMVTFENTAGNIEIVEVTSRAGDALTCVRGREGTLARAWIAGDAVEARITQGMLGYLDWNIRTNQASGIPLLDGTTKVPQTYIDTPVRAIGDPVYQPKLGYTPVQQGTGIGQATNVVKIGWSVGSKLKATVDATDLGNIALETWASATFKAIAYVPAWTDITGKPGTFPPSAHTHPTSDISGLDAALGQRAVINATNTANITFTGTIQGGAVIDTSDRSIKNQIKDMSVQEAYELVFGVRARRYFNTQTNRHEFGVIADEQEKTTPELVYSNNGLKGVRYQLLVAPLSLVVRDLDRRLQQLETS